MKNAELTNIIAGVFSKYYKLDQQELEIALAEEIHNTTETYWENKITTPENIYQILNATEKAVTNIIEEIQEKHNNNK